MINWRDKFIADIGRWYKFLSVQLAGLGAALSVAWVSIPESLRNQLPQHFQSYLSMFVFALIAFARVVKQPAPPIEANVSRETINESDQK